MQFFDRGLQLRNRATKIGSALLRHCAVTSHVVRIEFRDGNPDEREIDVDGMGSRDPGPFRSERLPRQDLQKLLPKPSDRVLDGSPLLGENVANIRRKDALGSCGIQRLFDVPQQFVDVLTGDQQALALARIQRDVVLAQFQPFHRCGPQAPFSSHCAAEFFLGGSPGTWLRDKSSSSGVIICPGEKADSGLR